MAERFAGYAEWHCTFGLSDTLTEACLRLPEWSDALTLDVNGVSVPIVAGFGHEVDVPNVPPSTALSSRGCH